MNIIQKFLILLTNSERKNALLLIFLILIMALLDMIGVASILPFMAVLTNPSIVETNVILNKMFQISKSFELRAMIISFCFGHACLHFINFFFSV